MSRDPFAGDVRFILVIVAVVFAGWMAWAVLAQVRQYATTADARVESVELPVAAQPSLDGVVERVEVELGEWVEEGDVLVSLDASAARRTLVARESKLRAVQTRKTALVARIDALELQLEALEQVNDSARASTRQKHRAAVARAKSAQAEAARAMALTGMIAQAEREGAVATSRALSAQVGVVRYTEAELVAEQRLKAAEVEERMATLRGEEAALTEEARGLEADVADANDIVERHVVRASMSGYVAALEGHAPGDVVGKGETLAALVGRAELRVVAWMAASQAFGRVAEGATGRMRLDAFPWLSYGSLTLEVREVARERSQRGVRVELAIVSDDGTESDLAERLVHGLPGQVEIETATSTPAELMLQALGRSINGEPGGRSP
ncbi:MAG: HlyD family efflux transporter periplasmic adaptor subunit [Myxococcota bacterium]